MAQTATLEELKDAVSLSLQDKGVLRELKARLRAEIFHSIEAKELSEQAPEPCPENVFANELIREYLEFNEYKQTLSVFLPESGQREDTGLSRAFMAHDLHIQDERHVPGNTIGKPLPLLYSVIQILKDLPRSNPNPAVSRALHESLPQEADAGKEKVEVKVKVKVEDHSDDHFPVHPLRFENKEH